MKTPLTTAFFTILMATTASAQYTDYSVAIESPSIIQINPAAFPSTLTRGVQVRYNTNETANLAATQDHQGNTTWNGSQREKMGGQDAPARILLRAFDGIFSIDPFVPISQANAEDFANMLFNGTTLETDRALFNRQRIERTQQLLNILESARINWLQNNGFYGVKSFTSSRSSAQDQSEASAPEPAARFRIPADIPRGKAREQVNSGSSNARSIAANLLSGDEPVRISLPFGTAHDVVASVEARNAENANENAEEQAELASSD